MRTQTGKGWNIVWYESPVETKESGIFRTRDGRGQFGRETAQATHWKPKTFSALIQFLVSQNLGQII
jgi:hypothetical protein